jgi:thioredoxin 1
MSEEIYDANFQEMITERTCVVLFYKNPCPYCKTMKAVLEKFGKAVPQVKLFQLNGLENTRATGQYSVEGFPDLIFFKNGKEMSRQKGLTNPQGLKKIYNSI